MGHLPNKFRKRLQCLADQFTRIWQRYDTRSIFKQSKSGLNSEFSYSPIDCLTKAKEPSLPYYIFRAGEENRWIHTFPEGISTKKISWADKFIMNKHCDFFSVPNFCYTKTNRRREKEDCEDKHKISYW